MIGKLNHIAIAVPDLNAACQLYRDAFGASLSEPLALPEHGVTAVFVDLGNSKLELLEPLGEHSPIARFLQKNPAGGMHHFCVEVDDIEAAITQAKAHQLRILGDGKTGAHGKPVLFLHPKDALGCLVEFEQSS